MNVQVLHHNTGRLFVWTDREGHAAQAACRFTSRLVDEQIVGSPM
jgi:hypothetical protein